LIAPTLTTNNRKPFLTMIEHSSVFPLEKAITRANTILTAGTLVFGDRGTDRFS
jgi:hypothetical protein